MNIKREEEILNIEVRQAIISDINSQENIMRKNEAYKRYLCLKDQTNFFVIEQLLKQFELSTVLEMSYCISNISFTRKIIEKLARVYSNGVERESDNELDEDKIKALERVLNINSQLKTTNKYLKLQKNIAFYVKPYPIYDNDIEKYDLALVPLNPYLYDVVENFYNKTKPMVYILSDFNYTLPTNGYVGEASLAGRTQQATIQNKQSTLGNGKDEIIADNPDDRKTCEYIFWSDKYHFTCNEKGEIISDSIENDIKKKPFVNFAIDQDGSFWARGGDDLTDGSILINSVISQNQHIATVQGYGQFYMTGKNLPRNIKVGPTKAIVLEHEEGEPTPQLGFASANPEIAALLSLVESYIALLLTTNNLSTSSVSSNLSAGQSLSSGIAIMLDQSESREDINDQRQIFKDAEPEIWDIISRWIDVFGDSMVDSLRGNVLESPESINLKFHETQVIQSESEKLDNLKKRKELGIDSMIDLIKKDNPDYSSEEAEEKLKEILEEKIKFQMGVIQNGNDQSPSNKQQDNIDDRSK